MRGTSDKNTLDKFCIKFCKVVEKHCKYIIVSGFLVISSGRVRATEDIDMIIEKIPKKEFIRLHSDLIKKGFVCMQSDNPEIIFDDYLLEKSSVRYTEDNMPIPEMEIKFAKDALDNEQIKTRMKIPFTGLDIWFSSINFNIAFKEEYLKSDKDIEDAKHLRIVYKECISEDEIRNIKKLIRHYRL